MVSDELSNLNHRWLFCLNPCFSGRWSLTFAVIADESFGLLEKAIQESDVTKAFDAAHSLKGTLGNMGLTPMYEIIIQIVEPLRDGKLDGIAEKYEILMAKKAELVAIKESC